ncbi:MAG: GTP-binding protein HflX [Verrucomicrobiales bacterium]|jgi:GTP-binding protein HflX
MFEVREKPDKVELALLVGVCFDKREEPEAKNLLNELVELVDTLGIEIAQHLLIYVRGQNKSYLMGKGKKDEMLELAKELGVDVIIFDNQLSPAQQKNWEEESDLTVIDREEVILDIFAMRAHTKEAQLQVELAKMEYVLPRMTRMWTHLDRQRGGSGGGKGGKGASRGEGEQQIEVDRRLARKKISNVKAELEVVRRQRATQRKERDRNPIPHAAIVGYTNSGKSTLLNKLSDSSILAKDMLFATLDTTTRRIELPDGQPMLLTDTVGFIRNLPHRLIEAFKGTLEEAVIADFLIHVLDASSEQVFQFHETTLSVLKELGAADKKIVTVLNKIDLVEDKNRLIELQNEFGGATMISLQTGEGMEQLLLTVNEVLRDRVDRFELRIPQARADLVSQLHRECKVLSEDYDGNDVLITAIIPYTMIHLFEAFASS